MLGSAHSKGSSRAGGWDGALRVLIADDEPLILSSTATMLRDLSHDVRTVADATRILAEARAFVPDVLLQDLRMPDLDVPRLVAVLRAEPGLARTRIVLFSGSINLEDVAAQVAADGALPKPVTPVELLQAVQGPDRSSWG